MKAEKINEILLSIIKKESTTDEEKSALIFAGDCVWKASKTKVVDEETFKQMLFDNMVFEYDVEVNKTNDETEFLVKTFKK